MLVPWGEWVLVGWVPGPGPLSCFAAVFLALRGLLVTGLLAGEKPVGLWLVGG